MTDKDAQQSVVMWLDLCDQFAQVAVTLRGAYSERLEAGHGAANFSARPSSQPGAHSRAAPLPAR